MFGDVEGAFTALRDRTPEPPFVPADTVRRRGRRRTYRQIAGAAVAVVAVVVGAGALVAGPPAGGRVEPAASAGPGGAATPTDRGGVPGRFVLQPADLPPGYGYLDDAELLMFGPYPIHIACADYEADWESRGHRQADRAVRFYADEDRADMSAYASAVAAYPQMRRGGPVTPMRVQQHVVVYEPGWGARGPAEYRTWIDACPGRAGVTYTVLNKDFAGDESVVYRVQQQHYMNYLLGIVRVGDRVSVLSISKSFSPDAARDLVESAAKRLAS